MRKSYVHFDHFVRVALSNGKILALSRRARPLALHKKNTVDFLCVPAMKTKKKYV